MKKLLTCLALSTILLSGCNFMHKSEGIIKVNDIVITQDDFDKAFDKTVNKSFLKSFGGAKNLVKSNDNPMYNIFKDKVTNELIIKSLLDEEIAKRKIVVKPEDFEAELKTVIDKVGSKEELNKILKQRGVSNKQFTEDLNSQIKIKKLVNSLEKINITDNETKKYYDTHKSEFTHGEQVRASHILISANTIELIQKMKEKNPSITTEEMNKQLEKTLNEQKKLAENVLAEVKKSPDDFAKLAEKYSEDPGSKSNGGELGFFTQEAMVPEFSKAAFSMKPNTISDSLIQTAYGYHIIKVTDRMEAGTTPYNKIKDEIKFYLETEKQLKVLNNFIKGAVKNAKIEYLVETYKPKKSVSETDNTTK